MSERESRVRSEKGKFIIERRYIDDDRIIEPDKLESGGVDMSGRWGLLVLPRIISSFDSALTASVRAHPKGSRIGLCWQCGNCTAACPAAESNSEFNPRHFIYLAKMGYTQELKRAQKSLYLCTSCGRCAEACPKGVNPGGVIEAIGTVVRRGGRL